MKNSSARKFECKNRPVRKFEKLIYEFEIQIQGARILNIESIGKETTLKELTLISSSVLLFEKFKDSPLPFFSRML